ncbi:MAG: fatty-acid desaturase [Psychroserpens sp.]|jgi:fatty-acid desaturase
MTVSEQKRLVKRLYLVSMFFNVILPLLILYMMTGDKSGEVKLLFVALVICGFTCLLVNSACFFIPEF